MAELKDKSKVGVIFDTISVKAHWERWCRWNCDPRVINARKKGIFCRTESVAMTPKSRDHMPTTSLWGIAAKWLKLRRQNWYFAQETPKDTAVLVWACQAGFWKSTGTSCQLRHAVFHGVCEIALTAVLATQMGVMQRNKKVSLSELYKLNPLSPHCGSIVWELMHCYTWGRLRIVTVRGNTAGQHS